jgi:hypothetical protein
LNQTHLNGVHGGFDRSAEDAYSSKAPDPTFAFLPYTCNCLLDYGHVLHIVSFAILLKGAVFFVNLAILYFYLLQNILPNTLDEQREFLIL